MDPLHLAFEDDAAPPGRPSKPRATFRRDAWRAADSARPHAGGPFALPHEDDSFADTLVLPPAASCTPAAAARGELRASSPDVRRPGAVAPPRAAVPGVPPSRHTGRCDSRADRPHRVAWATAGAAALALAAVVAGRLAGGDPARRLDAVPTPSAPASTVAQVIRRAPAPVAAARRRWPVDEHASDAIRPAP